MDNLQRLVLQRCEDWAAPYSCAVAIYVFGSIARGDYRRESDVDIYAKIEIPDHRAVEDFTEMHRNADGFAILLGQELRRDVHIHGMVLAEPTDHAWPAIEKASTSPTATIGKAHLVPTPAVINPPLAGGET